MTGLDIAGVVLASGDAIVQILAGIRRRNIAHEKIPGLIDSSVRRVKRICDTIRKYQTALNMDNIPGDVFQRVVDDFNTIKNQLDSLQARLSSKARWKNWLSSQEVFGELTSIFERLSPLENHLDVCGLVAYSHASITKKLADLVDNVEKVIASEHFSRVDDVHLLLEQIQAMMTAFGSHSSTQCSVAEAAADINDESVDDLERSSLHLLAALPEKTKELLRILSSSGISVAKRQELANMIRNLWSGWKLNYADVRLEYKGRRPIALGEGAFSNVLKGELLRRGPSGDEEGAPLLVAIKDLRIPTHEMRKREPDFLREIFLQMDMDHPCVVRTYGGYWPEMDSARKTEDELDSDDEGFGTPFIVMERMTCNLEKGIRKELLKDKMVQRRVLLDVAMGLAHLHSKHVVHRDIKQGNILLRLRNGEMFGHAKIGDFGVSRQILLKEQQTLYASTSHASGTIVFMPPEVLFDIVNCASRRAWDVWSFGVLLCQVVAPENAAEMSDIQPVNAQNLARSGDLAKVMARIASNIEDPTLRAITKDCLKERAEDRLRMKMVVQMLVDGIASNTLTEIDLSEGVTHRVNGKGSLNERAEDRSRMKMMVVQTRGEGLPSNNLAETDLSEGDIETIQEQLPGWDALLPEMHLMAGEGGEMARTALAIGKCYLHGVGVEKNLDEAVRLYRLAADDGNKYAQYQLGDCYENGIGVVKNVMESARLYRLAADAGYAPAQNSLGHNYMNGIGMEKDMEEAVRLYRLAADAGNSSAQVNLGDCYRDGIVVEKDVEEAVRLYRLAADAGNILAQVNLGDRYRNGIGVEKDVKEAVRLYRLAADAGNSSAQVNLGDCYRDGIVVEKDVKEAVRLYRLAADAGNILAQENLGDCYRNGIGVEKDMKEAERLYRLAAYARSSSAQESIWDCYTDAGFHVAIIAEARGLFRSIMTLISDVRRGPDTFRSLTDELNDLMRHIAEVEIHLRSSPEGIHANIRDLFNETLASVRDILYECKSSMETVGSKANTGNKFKAELHRTIYSTGISGTMNALQQQLGDVSTKLLFLLSQLDIPAI